MRLFSTFTGIGGFEIGAANASLDVFGENNVELVGYSEIDKFAIQVFDYWHKGVKNYGDITKIKTEELPDFDCLVGGFPCQAFSIAGKRGGFTDTRGTLFFELARILRAKQPRLFVFENVKGLLNHDSGKTFRTIITAIDELGYDCQWQVLNSKDFGVPQNRERIIIVGHLRGTPRPQVFPIIRADSQAISQDVRVGTLRTHKDGNGFREMKSGFAPTIPARAREDGSGQPVVYVPEATRKGYAEATVGDSINLQAINSKTRRGRVGKGIANTLDTGMHQYTIQPPVQLTEARTEEAKQIRRESIKAGKEYAPRRGKVLVPRKDHMANTVTAGRSNEGLVLVSKTVRAGGRNSPHGSKQNWDSYDIGGGIIRRLTPMECERLQAFPDNWTKYGVDINDNIIEISDTQRYKMAGNAVTTKVIQAVFERIFSS